jgi:hypothetical protein
MRRISGIGVALMLMAGHSSLLFAEEEQTEGSYSLAELVDMEQKARLDFQQAVTLQLEANSSSPKNPKLQLEQATRLYFAYLEVYPQSSAAENNLAKAFESLGDLSKQRSSSGQDNQYHDIAVGFYKEAIKANDSNKGLYLKNYADFLERTGDWGSAKENYAQMIKGYPISPSLQKTLEESHCQKGPGDLIEYLWTLQSAGYITESANIALEILQSSKEHDKRRIDDKRCIDDKSRFNDTSRIELLTIVCTALAERFGNPESFLDSDIFNHIDALATDSLLGEGAVEILRVYDGPEFIPKNDSWWVVFPIPQEDPVIGVWRTDAFRALIRSLGSHSRHMGDQERAESYFLLALDLQEQDIDPEAIRALALLYAEENEFDKINSLIEFQDRLKASDTETYRVSREKKISESYRTVGELYALVGEWGSGKESEKHSAIFQIERAIKMSKKIDNKPLGNTPEYPLHYDPGLIDTLATGYVETNKKEQSVNLRLDTAKIYKDAGIEEAKEYMLAPLDFDELTRAQKKKYKDVQSPDDPEPDEEEDQKSIAQEAEQNSGSTECIYSNCKLVDNWLIPERPVVTPSILLPPPTNPPGRF